ncbi:MAG TPA: M17 family peptidase N-terminal domain-containing protein, partial [Hyphomicrobiaceae bacterium]|nr:M17 family peptidase N-terminal domain-containing protein [Hyphomicrobiaceae bacterium]
MPEPLAIEFASLSASPAGTLVVLAGQELAMAPATRGIDERTKGALTKAARAAEFTGKAKSAIEILAPAGIDSQRL